MALKNYLDLKNFKYRYKNLLESSSNNGFWCTMDLADCFTNINHEILYQIIEKIVLADR